jgi:hypothetical protein
MKINWQENKLTIIGFGIIFIILGIFGYILWNITREPMAEISSEDTPVVTTPPIIEQQPEIVKEELPEYRITKVDTTGWESKEFKVGDVGIRYKSPTSNINLTRYGLPQDYSIFNYDASIDKSDLFSNYRLRIDYLISIDPTIFVNGRAYWLNPIEISIVESKDLTLENIFNVFANNQCKYNVIESEGGMSLYEFIPQNCETQEQVTGYEYDEKFNGPNVKATITRVEKSKRLDEVTELCLDGEKTEQFKNPFIVQNDINKATNLIKCNSILGVDDNKNIQKRERELFILSLNNNKFAIINYQDTGIPGVNGIDKDNSEKVNNLMHTILSTIEVL